MTLSINQPGYLPWLGYFHRIAISDRHVVLNHVQFEKNGYTNRNRVRGANGPIWLTVPVLTSGRFGEIPIATIEIDRRSGWAQKHWRTLEQNYRRAPYFPAHADFFGELYRRDWQYLGELCSATTDYLLASLGVTTPLIYSSTLDLRQRKGNLVLEIATSQGANVYLSGPLGRDYLDEQAFAAHAVSLRYHDYRHPQYSQLGDRPFDASLSIVDLLFNHGPNSLAVLSSGQHH